MQVPGAPINWPFGRFTDEAMKAREREAATQRMLRAIEKATQRRKQP